MQLKNKSGQQGGDSIIPNQSDKGGTNGTAAADKNGENGNGLKQAGTTRKNSSILEEKSSGLKEYWETPKDVWGFASQTNKIATMILNEEIDIEKARTFAALARTISQAATNKVNIARLTKEAPDLEFENDLFENQ